MLLDPIPEPSNTCADPDPFFHDYSVYQDALAADPLACVQPQSSVLLTPPLDHPLMAAGVPHPMAANAVLGKHAALPSPAFDGWLNGIQKPAPSTDHAMEGLEALSPLIKSDLSRLYFDRVQELIPIISRRRFMAQANTATASGSAAFECLQYTMWAFASAVTSQFQFIREPLYHKASGLLRSHDPDPYDHHGLIVLAQAWALMAMYETYQVNPRRGWLSAGRCSRLVQMMKLHQVDRQQHASGDNLTWTEKEERRRVFWMAYVLDGIIGINENLPFTFRDQEVPVFFQLLPVLPADNPCCRSPRVCLHPNHPSPRRDQSRCHG